MRASPSSSAPPRSRGTWHRRIQARRLPRSSRADRARPSVHPHRCCKGSPGMMGQHSMGRRGFIGFLLAGALLTTVDLAQTSAQVRSTRRGAVAKGDDGAVAAGPRGVAVKGEEGYAAAGRRGAVASGEEGYAAVGRRGNVVTGDDIDVQGAAVGRRGAVVVGEEGAAAVGRYGGVVVGNR